MLKKRGHPGVCCLLGSHCVNISFTLTLLCFCLCSVKMEKVLRETQTLRAGCSKAEPKNFAPPQTPFPRARDVQKFNQLEMVTTFTYKPILVLSMHRARNIELSW